MLDLPVSKKKNFGIFFLCSYVPVLTPGASYMNKLGRGPLEDATYQISKLYQLQFGTGRFPSFSLCEIREPTI